MNPTLSLVAELVARGSHVTYFVEETMREVVEAVGATWCPFRYPDSDFTGTHRELSEAGIAKYVPEGTPKEEFANMQHALVYNAEVVLPRLIEDLRAFKVSPTVIVYDPLLAFAQVAAHVLGIPAVGMLTMPGPGVMTMPDQVRDMWMSKPWVQGPRTEILARYGFDVLQRGMLLEFYSPTLNLVTTISDLYVPPRVGRQQEHFGSFPFQCVGVLADAKVKRIANANVKEGLTEELPMALIDEALSTGQKLVYISMGTVIASSHFWDKTFAQFGKDNGLEHCTGRQLTQHVFRTCFEALGGSKDILVVMSVGPYFNTLDELPQVPSNFVLRQTVPQLELLRRCAAFVTHGGANSMHEALYLGVPMMVVPAFADQPLNADSVAAVGAGISFRNPLVSLTVASLSAALQKLIEPKQNSFRAAAGEMSEKLRAAGGSAAAAEAILKVQARNATIGGA